MAVYKHQITNQNPIIQEKARYFADSFDFCLSQLGNFGFASLENQRSLFEKIRFHLRDYEPYSSKYITHHLSGPLLSGSNPMLRTYYPNAVKLANQIRAGKYKTPAERVQILSEMDEILRDMENTLLKYALEEVQTVLHCPEPLIEHEHMLELDRAAEIIIPELIFKGHPIKDLDKLIEKIMSNEVKITQNTVKTRFPLPAGLRDQKKTQGTAIAKRNVEEFMNNRTLRQQFDGIYNLYEAELQNKAIFRIINTKSKKKVDKSYGNVRLTNQIKSYLSKDMNAKYRNFFSAEDSLFIEVSLPYVSMEGAARLSKAYIGKSLALFNHYFRVNLLVDFKVTVIKIDGLFSMRSSFSSDWIREINPNKSRREKQLRKLDNPASKRFLHLESLYAEAKTGMLPDEQLGNYWRYLESCFSGMGLTATTMQSVLAEILSNNQLAHAWVPYCQLAMDVLQDNRQQIQDKGITLSYREIMDFMGLEKLNAKWVIQANQYLRHPLLCERYEQFSAKTVGEIYGELYKYYQGILLEAYEQRNAIQHSGMFQQMALDKVLLNLPQVVASLREIICSKILKGKLTSYAEILESLRLPSNKIKRHIKLSKKIIELS